MSDESAEVPADALRAVLRDYKAMLDNQGGAGLSIDRPAYEAIVRAFPAPDCAVDAAFSGPHAGNRKRADWRIVTASGETFYACDAHIGNLLYFDGTNEVTAVEVTDFGRDAR